VQECLLIQRLATKSFFEKVRSEATNHKVSTQVLGTIYGLPVVFALPAVPSIIYLLASFRIPETPYHLLRTGTEKDALEVVQILRKSNEVHAMKNLDYFKLNFLSQRIIRSSVHKYTFTRKWLPSIM